MIPFRASRSLTCTTPAHVLRQLGVDFSQHYPMSGKHNRRQKQLQQASKKILEIARRNKLLNNTTQYHFVWVMKRNTDFSEQQLEFAWNQHYNSNKPTKAEALSIQRKKDTRIAEARFHRNTRARHPTIQGNTWRAMEVQRTQKHYKNIESKTPTPPKRDRKGKRLF